jgi:hypothetical protein
MDLAVVRRVECGFWARRVAWIARWALCDSRDARERC